MKLPTPGIYLKEHYWNYGRRMYLNVCCCCSAERDEDFDIDAIVFGQAHGPRASWLLFFAVIGHRQDQQHSPLAWCDRAVHLPSRVCHLSKFCSPKVEGFRFLLLIIGQKQMSTNSSGTFAWANNKWVTIRLTCLFETAIYRRYSRRLPIRRTMK